MPKGFGGEKWRVSVQDQHITGESFEQRQGLLNGVTGPVEFNLMNELDATRKRLFDLLSVSSHHHDQTTGTEVFGSGNDMAEHRAATQFVEHLRTA